MSNKEKCYVGFDTSNYTTSIAVCDEEGEVVANFKRLLTVKEGERGLRQSDAVFSHIKNLPILTGQLRDVLKTYEPIAVGVSSTPRMQEGSYMPCFLCGVAAANTFAASLDLPIYETSHQHGHIMAAAYSSGAKDYLMGKERFLALHVSGGTTEALLVTPNKKETFFDVEIVGATNDINAGQAIDRVGVMMGLSFPAGSEMELLATKFDGKISKRNICVKNGYCNLSGVENIAKTLFDKGESAESIAAFVFDFIQRTLIEMISQIIDVYGDMPVLLAGGVMSNKLMRAAFLDKFDAYFAKPEFSSDNAAGVSVLCRERYKLLKE